MATGGCTPVKFCGTFENAFYFQDATETDTGVDEDSFTSSSTPSFKQYWVKSKDSKFLLLKRTADECQFQAQNLTTGKSHELDCKFKIKLYNDSLQGTRSGSSAMLYITANNKTFVVCCSSNRDIYPKEMALPSNIGETKSEAVFYMLDLDHSHTYTFESSQYEGRFLAFESDRDNGSLSKLVLYQKSPGETVDACQISLLEP